MHLAETFTSKIQFIGRRNDHSLLTYAPIGGGDGGACFVPEDYRAVTYSNRTVMVNSFRR